MTTARFWIQEPKACVTRLESRYHHGNSQRLGDVTSPCGPACCGLRGRKPGSQGRGAPPLGAAGDRPFPKALFLCSGPGRRRGRAAWQQVCVAVARGGRRSQSRWRAPGPAVGRSPESTFCFWVVIQRSPLLGSTSRLLRAAPRCDCQSASRVR